MRDHRYVDVLEDELAGCLRSWRERLSPTDVGLPAGGRRRVAGLRREEVAQLAGVSVDYLSRLEQSRAQRPSPSVLASLARALRLTSDERSHLLRIAGYSEPGTGTIDRHITPSVQRLLDRLADLPAMVVDAAGELVAANALATALIGDLSGLSRRERNFTWRQFTDVPSPLLRTPEEKADAEAGMVAEMHDALGRYPEDEHLRSMIDDLRADSPRFAELWEQHSVVHGRARRKTFLHPEVGTITLDCDALAVEGSDLRLVVYTAPAGSSDAERIALLGAIGLQAFSGEA